MFSTVSTITAIALAFAGLSHTAYAQPPEPEFMNQLFRPELIMRHASEIELQKSQRQAITKAVSDTQAKTLEFSWDMQDAAVKLGKLVSQDKIDEEAALIVATRVMQLESQIKRAHMRLLIQLKNQLDSKQQKKLRRLRAGD
jgi:Spy/CpxP family protein refolding chaperone